MSHPYCFYLPTCQLEPFFTMKLKKQPTLVCLIDAIGASARPMALFSGFYESPGPPPLGNAHSIVPPHRNNGYIIHRCFVCYCPGGRRGNTELVVARWLLPVASGVSLDMLHWAMPHVSLQRLTMAIKMAHNRGAFVLRRRLFRLAYS